MFKRTAAPVLAMKDGVRLSADAPPGRKLRTQDGKEIDLRCPVCGNGEFASTGPDARVDRAGFQHVIVGINEAIRKQIVLPVKFLYCLNCGFIMKFMLKIKEEE